MSLGDIHLEKEYEIRLGQYKSVLEQRIQQLEQDNKEMLEMLRVARCPTCDGSGGIIVMRESIEAGCCNHPLPSGECCGNPVPVPVPVEDYEQCQFCAERDALIAKIESRNKEGG